MSAEKEDAVFFVEDDDGFVVRVPESKLTSWGAAQQNKGAPLNKAEEELRRRLVESIYGRKG